MATLEELEKRIQVLEDIEAIRHLKARYGELADGRYRTDPVKEKSKFESIAGELAQLFTEDAVLDGGQLFKLRRGRAEICEYFAQRSFNFGLHYFVKPDITIESSSKAYGKWYLLMPATTKDNKAVWLSGYEDDKYSKVNGKWLHSQMRLTVLFLAPYEQGWASQGMLV